MRHPVSTRIGRLLDGHQRPESPLGPHPDDRRSGIHPDRRTGRLRRHRAARVAGRVVRDDSQRPRPARGAGLRAPAAHLRRPGADRSRLSLLRGPAAGDAASGRPLGCGRRRFARPPAKSRRSSACSPRCRTCCRRTRTMWALRWRPPPTISGCRRSSSSRVGGSRVLVLAVAESGHVTQKVVDTGDVLSPDDLRRAAECINQRLLGPRHRGSARRDSGAAAGRARAVRPPAGARASDGRARARRAARANRRFTSTAPRRCSPRRRSSTPSCRSARCARWSR